VPPLDQLVPVVVAAGDWVGLRAKLGRRGTDRPVLLGRDSGGIRSVTTAADGMYRWDLRGGAAREAYRAVIASGVDWLLSSDAINRGASLSATDVVARGSPVAFRWTRPPLPDSAVIRLAGKDTTFIASLRFDPEGVARIALPPGIWHWAPIGVTEPGGTTVVEEYSDEYRLQPVSLPTATPGGWLSTIELRPRGWWWLFVIPVIAFCAEWAWRLRRGLP
jgi:hypothetical protein